LYNPEKLRIIYAPFTPTNAIMQEPARPDHFDFVLVYNETQYCALEHTFNRIIFLQNCQMNGLQLHFDKATNNDGDSLVYILVSTPPQLFFQLAEKLKIQLPIVYNEYDFYVVERNFY